MGSGNAKSTFISSFDMFRFLSHLRSSLIFLHAYILHYVHLATSLSTFSYISLCSWLCFLYTAYLDFAFSFSALCLFHFRLLWSFLYTFSFLSFCLFSITLSLVLFTSSSSDYRILRPLSHIWKRCGACLFPPRPLHRRQRHISSCLGLN